MDEDAPITLKEACAIVFRDTISVATLRAEATRNKISFARIGKRDFTSIRAVKEMIRKCHDESSERGSTQTNSETSGLSEMEKCLSAQAAALSTAEMLKRL